MSFQHSHYQIHQKPFVLAGGEFRAYDPTGALCFFVHKKGFKLKEDIRFYADTTKQKELLSIQARQIIDFSGVYDVMDSETGERLGAVSRKGWKSMIRDEWAVLDANDNVIATMREDSTSRALLRRFIGGLIAMILMPQSFRVLNEQGTIAEAYQNRNPLAPKLSVTFSPSGPPVDRRLALSAILLLMCIEGREG
ncbi:MAG: hypothetical protein HUU60_00480 [Armatimonadetes bacterium]|nr:hypothetical protein [Armatimonadota bacterium]